MLSSVLDLVAHFQRRENGMGSRVPLRWKSPGKHLFNQMTKVNFINDVWDAVMRRVFTVVGFFPKTHNPRLIMRKTSGNPRLVDMPHRY